MRARRNHPDIETVLRFKAVDFSHQRIAATYLVLHDNTGTEGNVVIAGYRFVGMVGCWL
jgi:hypothetical protein